MDPQGITKAKPMDEQSILQSGERLPPEKQEVRFSNAIRLTGRQWVIVGVFGVLIAAFSPNVWKRVEAFSLIPDYRVPHDLSNDYWHYQRCADQAAERYDTVLIGDSVIWGEYVAPEQTLSHYLNELTGQQRFANLGLDGAHPLALRSLVDYYSRSVAGKNVILECNPLWLTSPKVDFQTEDAPNSHPNLLPQFWPRIPAAWPHTNEIQDRISPHLGVVIGRYWPMSMWTTHLQVAYYEKKDIPGWTVQHPYDDPLGPLVKHDLPSPDERLRHLPEPWYKHIEKREDYAWVDLKTSFQWQAFRETVEILQKRGNRVFVIVGPFNEHLMTPGSLERYQGVKAAIAQWLEEKQIPHVVPEVLPSELYGDASHPLAAGYALLARRLLENASFRSALMGR